MSTIYSIKMADNLFWLNGEGPYRECRGQADMWTGRCLACGARIESSSAYCTALVAARRRDAGEEC